MALILDKREFELAICKALGIEPYRTVRIIIDLNARDIGPIPVYVEMLGDENLLEIGWDEGLGDCKIIREPKDKCQKS